MRVKILQTLILICWVSTEAKIARAENSRDTLRESDSRGETLAFSNVRWEHDFNRDKDSSRIHSQLLPMDVKRTLGVGLICLGIIGTALLVYGVRSR